MKYVIDIDGTICNNTYGDYSTAIPYSERIALLNDLFNKGHEIHYWTARGAQSGKDWTELTLSQLKDWGCLYTTASLGKLHYDVWIDDKAFNALTFFDN